MILDFLNAATFMRQRGFACAFGLAALVAIAGCGSHASSSTPAAGAGTLSMAKSRSPGSIAAAPMRGVAPQVDTMNVRGPQSTVTPLGWTQLPGAAVAVAASPDGSIWVLSTLGTGRDQFIYHYVNGTWTNIPGAAVRLAVGPDNTLWVVNSAGGIYSYNGTWTTVAGGASDISVGSDGSIYVISNVEGGSFGNGIWHYSGGSWTQLPGAATRIAASWDTGTYQDGVTPGGFWVTNASSAIFYFNSGTGFTQIPGAAAALAPTKNGGLFALGYQASSVGFPIYYDDLASTAWAQQPGAGVSIATDSIHVYVIGAAGGIYSAPVLAGGVAVAPIVGYLPPTGTGSFAGQLTSVSSGAMIVGISSEELRADGTATLTAHNLAFSLGSSVLSRRREPDSVSPPDWSGPHGSAERAVQGPAEVAAVNRGLRRMSSAQGRSAAVRRASALGTSVGSHTEFWVTVFPIGSGCCNGHDIQVGATLEAVAANGYVWVDDSLVGTAAFTAATIAGLAADLDNAYASDTAHYGQTAFTASAPGLVGAAYDSCDATGASTGMTVPLWVVPPDSKINAFVINETALGSGVGGYFADKNYIYQSAYNCDIGKQAPDGSTYTAQTIPHSNEAPLIYIGWLSTNPTSFEVNEDVVRATAHELQHLINFVNHVPLNNSQDEQSWINEGMSMLAQDLAVNRMFGIPHDTDDALFHANQFTTAPQNFSLTAFTGIDAGTSSAQYNCSGCYGVEFLFQRYMYDRFGGDAYLHSMLGAATGYAALQQATGTDPRTLITDFAVALAASNTGRTKDPRFGIGTLLLGMTYNDQFGSTRTLVSPATTALASSESPYVGTFAYYSVGSAALNQNLSAKDSVGGFGLSVGVVQK